MELRQYVSGALIEICEAVEEAREKVKRTSGIAIAPSSIDGVVQEDPSMIEFDVSIVVSESANQDGKGGAQINVVAANLQIGGSAASSTKSESQQRIRFAVPVHFQAHFVK